VLLSPCFVTAAPELLDWVRARGWRAMVACTVAGLYFVFWFQDEVGKNGFTVLGHHIT
jgi:hypothetical protein